MTSTVSKATRAVRASIESDTQHGAVVPPLHLSSNFAFAAFAEKREYDGTTAPCRVFKRFEIAPSLSPWSVSNTIRNCKSHFCARSYSYNCYKKNPGPALDLVPRSALHFAKLIETSRGIGPTTLGQPSGLTILKRCQLLRCPGQISDGVE